MSRPKTTESSASFYFIRKRTGEDAVLKIADFLGVGVAFGKVDDAAVLCRAAGKIQDPAAIFVDSQAAFFIGNQRFLELKAERGAEGIGGGEPGGLRRDEESGIFVHRMDIILVWESCPVPPGAFWSAERIDQKVQIVNVEVKGNHAAALRIHHPVIQLHLG